MLQILAQALITFKMKKKKEYDKLMYSGQLQVRIKSEMEKTEKLKTMAAS